MSSAARVDECLCIHVSIAVEVRVDRALVELVDLDEPMVDLQRVVGETGEHLTFETCEFRVAELQGLGMQSESVGLVKF